jgi:sulfur relay (sulfurtransferase) DsrC/TusE family protein
MKDDCYVLTNDKTGAELRFLPPARVAELLATEQDIMIEPVDGVRYVRAYYYAKIWPEHRITVNDFARKLGVRLPWPEN